MRFFNRFWIRNEGGPGRYRLSIFAKFLIVLALLFLSVLGMYGYSNRQAQKVVEEQLRSAVLSELSFFANRMDSVMESLSLYPVILSYDPHIRDYMDGAGEAALNPLRAQARIQEKLSLQSASGSWTNDLTVVLPQQREVLSSNIYTNGAAVWNWDSPLRREWTYEEDLSRGYPTGTFLRETAEPSTAGTAREAEAVFQVRFPVEALRDLLDLYRKNEWSDPFLFRNGQEMIAGSASDRMKAEAIRQSLGSIEGEQGQRTVDVAGETYIVSYVRSAQLGWYLADYVPMQRILSPTTSVRNWFYAAAVALVLIGLASALLLYRNVQIPLQKTIRGVRRMSSGDFSSRIDYRANNEFDDLIGPYNEMAGKIQVLIEDVYTEKLRSREATLKQLQSQINPHFLYNSLFFIANSAMMEDRDSVIAMAENLADYYRYSTRLEHQLAPLREELELVRSYLTIHNLRMERLQYSIQVPEEMLDVEVPRLLLQPLVENSIVHGIEPRLEGGCITIEGKMVDGWCFLSVADNGTGSNEEGLSRLRRQLQEPMSDEIGCGTWNVHQRLRYQFGEESGLELHPTPGGGLTAVLSWRNGSSGKLKKGGGET
ncbi:two-component system, sensor histidine kinase YesM [Paenibacillaceae bacterium GAS479]|nr:two-component system, sensor histidine kinase YesM [Paenibacillaceae bacterium GAS479]